MPALESAGRHAEMRSTNKFTRVLISEKCGKTCKLSRDEKQRLTLKATEIFA